MKPILIIIFSLYTIHIFAQLKDEDFTNAAILYELQDSFYKNLVLQKESKDTIINLKKFKKYEQKFFTDAKASYTTKVCYESFEDYDYTLLDENLETIHHFNYNTEKQLAIFYGKKEEITLRKFDILINKVKTSKDGDGRFFYNNALHSISIDLHSKKVQFSKGDNPLTLLSFFRRSHHKQIVYSSLAFSKSIENKIKPQIGNEIQISWYRTVTDFEKKADSILVQSTHIYKIERDTFIQGKQHFIMSHNIIFMHNKSSIQKEDLLIAIYDNYYTINNEKIPIQIYDRELKIIQDNCVFFQSVLPFQGKDEEIISYLIFQDYYTNFNKEKSIDDLDRIDGFTPKIMFSNFPIVLKIPDINYLIINPSYIKIGNNIVGNDIKVNPIWQDLNNINIEQDKNNILIHYRLKEKAKVTLKFGDNNNVKIISQKENDKGAHNICIPIPKDNPANEYEVLLEIQGENTHAKKKKIITRP